MLSNSYSKTRLQAADSFASMSAINISPSLPSSLKSVPVPSTPPTTASPNSPGSCLNYTSSYSGTPFAESAFSSVPSLTGLSPLSRPQSRNAAKSPSYLRHMSLNPISSQFSTRKLIPTPNSSTLDSVYGYLNGEDSEIYDDALESDISFTIQQAEVVATKKTASLIILKRPVEVLSKENPKEILLEQNTKNEQDKNAFTDILSPIDYAHSPGLLNTDIQILEIPTTANRNRKEKDILEEMFEENIFSRGLTDGMATTENRQSTAPIMNPLNSIIDVEITFSSPISEIDFGFNKPYFSDHYYDRFQPGNINGNKNEAKNVYNPKSCDDLKQTVRISISHETTPLSSSVVSTPIKSAIPRSRKSIDLNSMSSGKESCFGTELDSPLSVDQVQPSSFESETEKSSFYSLPNARFQTQTSVATPGLNPVYTHVRYNTTNTTKATRTIPGSELPSPSFQRLQKVAMKIQERYSTSRLCQRRMTLSHGSSIMVNKNQGLRHAQLATSPKTMITSPFSASSSASFSPVTRGSAKQGPVTKDGDVKIIISSSSHIDSAAGKKSNKQINRTHIQSGPMYHMARLTPLAPEPTTTTNTLAKTPVSSKLRGMLPIVYESDSLRLAVPQVKGSLRTS